MTPTHAVSAQAANAESPNTDAQSSQPGPVQVDLACQSAAFTTDPFSPEFTASLPVLQANGYKRVVLGPLDPSIRGLSDLGARIRDAGLTPIAMTVQSPDANVASDEAVVRRRGFDVLLRSIQLAQTLGADQLNGVPYGVHGETNGRLSQDAFVRAAQLVGDAADQAFTAGQLMTFEVVNRYETSVLNTAAEAVKFVEASGSRHLKIHLDTFHMMMEETDMLEAITHAIPHLGYLEFGQSSRGLLSTGALDLLAVYEHARALGYTGRYGVEGFSRNTMQAPVADGLKIWETTFATGDEFVHDAARLFR